MPPKKDGRSSRPKSSTSPPKDSEDTPQGPPAEVSWPEFKDEDIANEKLYDAASSSGAYDRKLPLRSRVVCFPPPASVPDGSLSWVVPWLRSSEASKSKEKVKFPFEDPAGSTPLPPSLAHRIAAWKRPCELEGQEEAQFAHAVVSPHRFERVKEDRLLSEEERIWLRRNNLYYPTKEIEPHVSLVSCNEHVLDSALMREVVAHLSALQRPGGGDQPHHCRPWELIYPQGEDGMPT